MSAYLETRHSIEDEWSKVSQESAHTPLALAKTLISREGGAKSGAPGSEKTPSDPDLALILDRWPKLPEHVRQTVVTLVRTIPDKEQAP